MRIVGRERMRIVGRGTESWAEVVGVTADSRYNSVGEPPHGLVAYTVARGRSSSPWQVREALTFDVPEGVSDQP